MQKITPFLWFDTQAEEAAHYYASVFGNSKIGRMSRYGKDGAKASGMPERSVMTIEFELDGQKFVGLNGGTAFKFNESVSFVVNCETQKEVDHFWDKLSHGGSKGPCGWLKDKYGLSWQIVPTILDKMLLDKDAAKAGRVMAAMLKMSKIEIDVLKKAYENK